MSDQKTWRDHHFEDINLIARTSMHSKHWMDFEVVEMGGRYLDTGELVYQKRDDKTGDVTTDINAAALFCHGHIKWDGCCEARFMDSHGCGREAWTRLGPLFDRLYDIAIESMEPHARQYLEKREVKS